MACLQELEAHTATLEGQVEELKTQLAGSQEECEALITEIQDISKAFEDMQEQNTRLLSQLNEHDDTHAQLVAEVL